MTPQTIAAGWLLVAAAFVATGVGVIWFCRSSLAERRAARVPECSCARRERYLAELLAEDESKVWAQAHVDAALSVARLAPVAPVIHLQRRGGES